MNVILAIKPEFAKKIFDGQKRFDFRKRIWVANDVEKVYLYVGIPLQKILGYFTIEEILYGSPDELWRVCSFNAGITKKGFFTYFHEKNFGYAIKIKEAFKFKNPVEPFTLSLDFKAPYNFHYVYPGPFKEKLDEMRETPISRTKNNGRNK